MLFNFTKLSFLLKVHRILGFFAPDVVMYWLITSFSQNSLFRLMALVTSCFSFYALSFYLSSSVIINVDGEAYNIHYCTEMSKLQKLLVLVNWIGTLFGMCLCNFFLHVLDYELSFIFDYG